MRNIPISILLLLKREKIDGIRYHYISFPDDLVWNAPLLKLWIDEVFDMKWLSGLDTSPVKGKKPILY